MADHTTAVDEGFEAWAIAVDEDLQSAREEAEPDETLIVMFRAGHSPEQAVAAIIARRSAALEAEPQLDLAPPAVEPVTLAPVEPVPPPEVPVPPPGFFLRVGGGYDSRASACRAAAQVARSLRAEVLVCDRDGNVLDRAPKKPPRIDRRPRTDLPAILELLARDEGASGAEIQAKLGWPEITPGPWFFRHWAERAGAPDDLEDLGVVDGQRRYRLRP